jgi:type I site-specific restriction endonuclease
MKPGNKRRDAWYACLSDKDMWEAFDACKQQPSWQQAVAWVSEKHGIKLGKSAFYAWLDWCRDNQAQHTLKNANAAASEVRALKAEFGDLEQAARDQISALVLDASASKRPEDIVVLVKALCSLGNAKEARLTERIARMTIEIDDLKKRLAPFEGQPASAALTPEQKSEKIKEAFGVK